MLRLFGRTALREWQERCTASLSSTLQSHRQGESTSSNYGFSQAGVLLGWVVSGEKKPGPNPF
jgi:hypothetical protein